jgi:two-component sensor histidine kinase
MDRPLTTQYKLWNRKALCLVLLFYWIMATLYYFTILFNVRSYNKPGIPFWAGESYARILLDYGLKFLLTIPVWFLIFRAMQKVSIKGRLAVHIITLPLFVFLWKGIYYRLCDRFGLGHLSGDAEVWDIYIPFLFYTLQFALFHVYHYYGQLQQEQLRSSILRALAYKSEIATLKAQIQPHFLFNTLNSISAGLPIEEEDTRQSIARLADTFRYAMNTAQKEQVSFREELDFIQNYLSLERERFSDRLEVVYQIDPDSLKASVPPLILQPLVENALKHGISKSPGGGVITLITAVKDRKIHFTITDTGAGLNGNTQKAPFKEGIGLQNTRLRLQKLYGEELIIRIDDPGGSTVYFSIPFSHCHE